MNMKKMKIAVFAIGACSLAMPAFASLVPALPMKTSATQVEFALNSGESTTRVLIARNKPRIPGGSGCDDARDILEHPECRVNLVHIHSIIGQGNVQHRHVPHQVNNLGHTHNGWHHVHGSFQGQSVIDISGSGRNTQRIPGGPGCDDANDILEHPECTLNMGTQ